MYFSLLFKYLLDGRFCVTVTGTCVVVVCNLPAFVGETKWKYKINNNDQLDLLEIIGLSEPLWRVSLNDQTN